MEMTTRYPSMTILGCTGSVGEQAIDVALKNNIQVNAICAHKNVKRVEEQARALKVPFCAMADEDAAKALKLALADTQTRVLSGTDGICEMIATPFDGDEIVPVVMT